MLGSDQSSAAILGPASLRAEAEFAVTGTGRLADRVWFESSTLFFWLSGAGDGGRALARAVSQGIVGLTASPQTPQEHGEFSRHGDDRTLARVLVSLGGESKSEAPEVGVVPNGPSM